MTTICQKLFFSNYCKPSAAGSNFYTCYKAILNPLGSGSSEPTITWPEIVEFLTLPTFFFRRFSAGLPREQYTASAGELDSPLDFQNPIYEPLYKNIFLNPRAPFNQSTFAQSDLAGKPLNQCFQRISCLIFSMADRCPSLILLWLCNLSLELTDVFRTVLSFFSTWTLSREQFDNPRDNFVTRTTKVVSPSVHVF